MTKERVLKVLKKNLEWQNYTDGNDNWGDELREAVTEAIKLMEQKSTSEDFVSRKEMLNAITEIDNHTNMDIYTNEVREIIKELPPVTPIYGTCKDCKWLNTDEDGNYYCHIQTVCFVNLDFYCADYEKRGSKDD